MYRVYGDVLSGNCYKVKLLLEQLRLPYEWIAVDILKQETRTPDFLIKNPNGKIPLLELADDEFLSESNAILYFLAEGSHLFPTERYLQAQVMQWLFFEQYSHEPYIATARYIIRYLGRPHDLEETLQAKIPSGCKALRIMDSHLSKHDFFVDDRYTIADIALFAYTHVAEEGGFGLAEYPAIQAWITRVKSQPDYVTIG